MKEKILVVDSTLRDGSHAISHQYNKKNIQEYAKYAQSAHIPIVMVGHGNGLGASSIQLGKSLLSDTEMLTTAKKELTNTQLGAFLIPGFGTIQNDLNPAIKSGITTLMVAAHCTEANVTKEHLLYAKKNGLNTYGVLMMSHLLSGKELLQQALLMQDYGVIGVLLMDSAGTYLPHDVKEKISILVNGLDANVGFHAHNNLGMAVANSVVAVENGATIIDATTRGIGAGAGNCQLEVFIAVIEKMGYKTNIDLYTMMDASDTVIAPLMKAPQVIDGIGLTSGLAGVFSGFAPHALRASERFGVDARDILIELGRRNIIAGQEGIIIDVALYLKNKNNVKNKSAEIEALI